MANLTIAVDDAVLRRARVRAAEQGTSVNAVLRAELERYAGRDEFDQAVDRMLDFARTHPGNSGGKRWSRDELYAERLGE